MLRSPLAFFRVVRLLLVTVIGCIVVGVVIVMSTMIGVVLLRGVLVHVAHGGLVSRVIGVCIADRVGV